MTWRQLAKEISAFTEEQQEQDVTVFVQSLGEFFGGEFVTLSITGEEPDILDPSSFYLDIGG